MNALVADILFIAMVLAGLAFMISVTIFIMELMEDQDDD